MNADSNDERTLRGRGENIWRGHGLSIEIVENTVDLGSLENVVQNLQPEFDEIEIRRRVAGPMAGGPGYGEAALILAFAVASHGFLSELGKDIYQGLRRSLYVAYQRVRTKANDRGYYPPLRIDVRYDGGPTIMFQFPEAHTLESFEAALATIPAALLAIDHSDAARVVTMNFESSTNSWVVDQVF